MMSSAVSGAEPSKALRFFERAERALVCVFASDEVTNRSPRAGRRSTLDALYFRSDGCIAGRECIKAVGYSLRELPGGVNHGAGVEDPSRESLTSLQSLTSLLLFNNAWLVQRNCAYLQGEMNEYVHPLCKNNTSHAAPTAE